MTFPAFVFWSLAVVTVVSAALVVTLKNAVHSALFLGVCLASVAGLFASLGADFLFAGQILIYVSGIAVLVVFVVMLLGRASDLHLRQVNGQWLAGLLVCAVTLTGLWRLMEPLRGITVSGLGAPTTASLGRIFMSGYAVPFELISLILTAALLGAIFFSHVDKK